MMVLDDTFSFNYPFIWSLRFFNECFILKHLLLLKMDAEYFENAGLTKELFIDTDFKCMQIEIDVFS